MFIRKYSKNLPPNVRGAMKKITNEECYVAERRIQGQTGSGRRLNCHPNVKEWVDKKGGERISGWLLGNDKQLQEKGIYTFEFHALWKTPENKCIDVTKNQYADRKQCYFYPDYKRDFNFEEGLGFNSIIIFAKRRAFRRNPAPLRDFNNEKLKMGKVYWTDGQNTFISLDDEKNSQFRIMTAQYPKNKELFEKKLDLTNKESSKELALLSMEFLLPNLGNILETMNKTRSEQQIDSIRF